MPRVYDHFEISSKFERTVRSIDPSFIVRQVRLYASELPPVHVLADRIYQAYPDASCEINSDVIIREKECTIVLSQYEEI